VSNIFVRIIGEFKDKEFKRAQKSTLGLTRSFDNLKRSAARAFIAVAGIAALKRSFEAFAKADQAIQSFNKSLDNLGLKYEAASAVDFIEQLEKATAVSKDQLFPAFRTLVSATLNVAKAQDVLKSALDISAGTGSSLTTVTTALARAYNGNYSSLGKLQNAYTGAELQALGFDAALVMLNNEFSGQAAADAATYQGKIEKLTLAVGDAKEAIGEGLVDAFEILGAGDYDKGLELLASGASKLATSLKLAAKAAAIFKYTFTTNPFDKDTDQFIADLNRAFTGRVDPAKTRALYRERAKYLKEEQAKTNKIRKDREKIAALLEKEKKNQKIIAEAQKGFDLERIQIEAALKGKINDVEEYRLKLQRAILNENVDNVIKYTGLLQEAEAQAAELADLLARLPEMAENPFTDWPSVIQRIQYLLKELDFQIPIDVLFAEKGLKLDQDKMTVTKLDTMNVNATNVFINGNVNPFGTTKDDFKKKTDDDIDSSDDNTDSTDDNTAAVNDLTDQIKTLTDLRTLTTSGTGINFLLKEHIDTLSSELSKNNTVNAIVDEATQRAAMAAAALAATYSNFDVAGFRMKENAPTVVVNLTENLQNMTEVLIEEQYQYQRSGGRLTYNTTAI